MSITEVNSVKLNVEESGTGPVVVPVHGIPQDYRAWKDLANRLSKDFNVINYSRRCALPNECRDYASSTIDNNVKDLEELIIRTGSGPVHLIGHSYGGPIVALLALRRPELVRSLVIIEPYLPKVVVNKDSVLDSLSLFIRAPSVAMSGIQSLNNINATIKGVSEKNMEKTLDTYYPNTWEGRDIKFKLSEPVRAMMLENMETFKELSSVPPSFNKADAARLVPPTLILMGEHTVKYQKSTAMELHKAVPKNELVFIRNASHYPHLENPGECNEAIAKFLSEHAN